MKLAIDPIQKVLLDDLVHDDGDQQVEENSREILDAGSVMDDVLRLFGANLDGYGDVVMQSDEE